MAAGLASPTVPSEPQPLHITPIVPGWTLRNLSDPNWLVSADFTIEALRSQLMVSDGNVVVAVWVSCALMGNHMVASTSERCLRDSPDAQRVLGYDLRAWTSLTRRPHRTRVIAAVGANGRQRQTRNRGASTSTVPNKVCSRRARRFLSGCGTRHCGQTRWQAAYSATWLCT